MSDNNDALNNLPNDDANNLPNDNTKKPNDDVLDYVNDILPLLKNKKPKKKEEVNYDAEEQEIRRLHEEIEGCARTTLPKARRIGELLLKRKAELGHGNYLPWLKKLGMPPRTAQTYTLVAKSPRNADTALSSIDALVRAVREGKKAVKAEERTKAAGTPAPTSFDSGIVTGDSLEWLRSQPSDSVPFFVSDPPYGIGLKYDGWKEPSTAEDYWAWFSPYWQEMTRVLQPGGTIVMWQGYTYLRHMWDWFPGGAIFAYGYRIRGFAVWTQLIHWRKKGGPALKAHYTTNDWLMGTQHKERQPDHPCPKPLLDCREVVSRFTLEGTLVVDPFCGLGTIPLACKLEGRKYLGIERSAVYAQRARDRIFNYKEEPASKKKPA